MHGIRNLATQVCADCLAVNNMRAHLDVTVRHNNRYLVLLNRSSAATSVGPSPEIMSRLSRLVAPEINATLRGGRPQLSRAPGSGPCSLRPRWVPRAHGP